MKDVKKKVRKNEGQNQSWHKVNKDKKKMVEWEGKRKAGREEGRERKRQSLLNNAVHMLTQSIMQMAFQVNIFHFPLIES